MNNKIKAQLEHKTIRKFINQPVSVDNLESLYKTAMRTATSSGMQTSSIIRVTDPDLKKQLSEICNQEYIQKLPEFWLFIVDGYRNRKINEEMGVKEDESGNLRNFFQAYIDAAITAQNVQVAAENLGLGTVYFGSIYNNIERLIEIFKLPRFTFPVVGLGFGYPNEKPQLKPRMDKKMRIFENSYMTFESYKEEIKDYSEELTTYYDLRDHNKRSESFTNLVEKHLSKVSNINILSQMKKQGFNID